MYVSRGRRVRASREAPSGRRRGASCTFHVRFMYASCTLHFRLSASVILGNTRNSSITDSCCGLKTSESRTLDSKVLGKEF